MTEREVRSKNLPIDPEIRQQIIVATNQHITAKSIGEVIPDTPTQTMQVLLDLTRSEEGLKALREMQK